MSSEKKTRKKVQFPHVFVLLTFVIILVTVLSYIIPAGVYDTVIDPVSGRSVIDPNSYHHVERTPVSLMQFIASFSNGFAAVAPLVFMTMAVGGAFGVYNSSSGRTCTQQILTKSLHGDTCITFLLCWT